MPQFENDAVNSEIQMREALKALLDYFAYNDIQSLMDEYYFSIDIPCVCVKCRDYFDEKTPDTKYATCPVCGSKAVMSAQVLEEELGFT